MLFCFFCIFSAKTVFAFSRVPSEQYSISDYYTINFDLSSCPHNAVFVQYDGINNYQTPVISSTTTSYNFNVGDNLCIYGASEQIYPIYSGMSVINAFGHCSDVALGECSNFSVYDYPDSNPDTPEPYIYFTSVSTSTCEIATSTDNIMDITAVSSDGTTTTYRAPFLLLLTFVFVIMLSVIFFIIFYQYGSSRRRINK